MKRIISIVALALSLPAAAQDFGFAERVLGWVKTGQGDSICAHLHPSLEGRVGPATFAPVFATLTAQLGALGEEGPWQREARGSVQVDARRMTFGGTDLLFQLATTEGQLIAGINFVPAPPRPAAEGADAQAWTERELTVSNGPIELPATLCLPAAAQGRVPVAVLVHGSGPADRDETLGPNKPFRELAQRLAQRGIGTLRYEKRTRQYAARLATVFPTLNYDTETVDDAMAALLTAAAQAEADTARLFVIGHSLGGMLAPRIARRSTLGVAGVVALAAPAQPLEPTLRRQMRHVVHTLEGKSVAEADSLADEIIGNIPASYRQAAARYDALAEARQASVPMLFVQGGHDYQVTSADFSLWQRALAERSDVSFLWLPTADHLLRPLPQPATPASYAQPGAMADEAIDAIAAFILQH